VYFPLYAIWSVILQVRHFPPLPLGPSFYCPAFSGDPPFDVASSHLKPFTAVRDSFGAYFNGVKTGQMSQWF